MKGRLQRFILHMVGSLEITKGSDVRSATTKHIQKGYVILMRLVQDECTDSYMIKSKMRPASTRDERKDK